MESSLSREVVVLLRLPCRSGALAAADRAGQVDHQRDRGAVVELFPADKGLPGSEVDGEAENGAQKRAPRPALGPGGQQHVARLAHVGEAPLFRHLLDDVRELGIAEDVRPAGFGAGK
jgi:hypothetical protein